MKPFMLRRRKATWRPNCPRRTDHNHFVPLHDLQKQKLCRPEQQVMKLVQLALRRPLTKQEQEKLQRELAMMRMIWRTPITSSIPKTAPARSWANLEKTPGGVWGK